MWVGGYVLGCADLGFSHRQGAQGTMAGARFHLLANPFSWPCHQRDAAGTLQGEGVLSLSLS